MMKKVYSFAIFFLVLFGTFSLPAQANNLIKDRFITLALRPIRKGRQLMKYGLCINQC